MSLDVVLTHSARRHIHAIAFNTTVRADERGWDNQPGYCRSKTWNAQQYSVAPRALRASGVASVKQSFTRATVTSSLMLKNALSECTPELTNKKSTKSVNRAAPSAPAQEKHIRKRHYYSEGYESDMTMPVISLKYKLFRYRVGKWTGML
jgi:hypothetical protein